MIAINMSQKNLRLSTFLKKLKHNRVLLLATLIVLIYGVAALGVWMGFLGQNWDAFSTLASFSPISWQYPFGTNLNGQDIFARAIYSIMVAMKIGGTVALSTTLFGSLFGSMAGLFHSTFIDDFITWMTGCFDTIPPLLFVAAVNVAFRNNSVGAYIAMIAIFWTAPCKVVRAQVIRLRHSEFVEAARALGCSNVRILFSHLAPNLLPILILEFSLLFVTAIKTEVVICFLGIRVDDGVSWGTMLMEASGEITAGFFNNFLAASIFMSTFILAFGIVLEAIQEILDPRISFPKV